MTFFNTLPAFSISRQRSVHSLVRIDDHQDHTSDLLCGYLHEIQSVCIILFYFQERLDARQRLGSGEGVGDGKFKLAVSAVQIFARTVIG